MSRDAHSDARMTFVVFSDDWGIHPSSSQHLFRRIVKTHDVHWVNTVGMRAPRFTLSDLRKVYAKVGRMLGNRGSDESRSRQTDGVDVYQPPMLPFPWRWSRSFNRWSVERVLRRIDFRGRNPIIVTTIPNACDYVDAIPNQRVVYYCVDDFSEWPGLDKTLILRMEQQLLEKSDLFVATSEPLFSRVEETGKPAELLPHGVDLSLFGCEARCVSPVLTGIAEPRVGYFGLFDDRSDQDLLASVANRLPEVSFIIAGRVEVSVSRLRELPNVHFVGPVAYEALPELIRGLSVLILPYRVNALSDALSPLKLKEYLVTGRPVVSTPIAAVRPLADCVAVCDTVEEWVGAIKAGIERPEPGRKERMLSRLQGESWDSKAEQFISLCTRLA